MDLEITFHGKEYYCFRHAVAHAFLAHEDIEVEVEVDVRGGGGNDMRDLRCFECGREYEGKTVLGSPLKHETRPMRPGVETFRIFPEGDDVKAE